MVAKIKTPKSILRVLNYNENKVKEGNARLIHAGNFLQEKEDMNFYDKLDRFEHLHALNQRTANKTVHISLNFHPTETFSVEKLAGIADDYMERIGFAKQPYLVYEHFDAGHPHIHIVTSCIQATGRRIPLHNIGRDKSEPARKVIESRYGLVRAEDQRRQQQNIQPVSAQKVIYGRTETKRSITNVLDAVLKTYKYSSLPELNAILRLYNVAADRGKEDSRIFQKGGLLYRILDDHGNKVGVPIKASSIHSKPTLAYLENQFQKNQPLKEGHAVRLKTAIDWTLAGKQPLSLPQLITALEKEGIATVRRQSAAGQLYGITFIDHRTRCVFNGSDLGKQYSAAGLQKRCTSPDQEAQRPSQAAHQRQNTAPQKPAAAEAGQAPDNSLHKIDAAHTTNTLPVAIVGNLVEQLFQPEYNFQGPEHHKGKKRRKRPSVDD
ncbi:relaxase/mobilization nuclease domain-containing protein [Chitinophaga vietnamensis]|uniref:relaxase/mobilization nuclease domain-containing protein n=1 Tax=Chitinophaga vietnamensis TaxID=2593957 RepID=UPI0011775B95|nr:relaxase/mobilization nuclease domain-containing protein [Chitinophaga vietnamensis]